VTQAGPIGLRFHHHGLAVVDDTTALTFLRLLGYTPGEREGSDFLDGGAGRDRLYGQGGADVLFGGTGDDYLDGDDADEEADGAAAVVGVVFLGERFSPAQAAAFALALAGVVLATWPARRA